MNTEISEISSEHFQVMTQHNGMRVKLEAELQNLRQFDAELIQLEGRRKDLQSSIDSYSLQKKQLDDQIIASEANIKKLRDRLATTLANNPWIPEYSSYGIRQWDQFFNSLPSDHFFVGSLGNQVGPLTLLSTIWVS